MNAWVPPKKRLLLEEQIELGRRVREEGDKEARDMLVLCTMPLVGWIARKYLWSKIEYEDLVQEGSLGLIIAAQRWDSRQGFAFGSFAGWWIRQMMSRIAWESGAIRMPLDLGLLIHKIRLAMSDIAIREGRPPTLDEIAATLELSPSKVTNALRFARMSVVSLNQPAPENSITPRHGEPEDWIAQIADVEALRADHILEARQELNAACERLNHLVEVLYADPTIADKHRDMFVRFYGLDGTLQRRTFEATGEQFDATKGAVCIAISRIWPKLQESGLDMDHDSVIEESARIAALEKLVHKRVSVS